MRKNKNKRKNKPVAPFKSAKPVLYVIFLSVVVIALYAKTTRFEFVGIDDAKLIFENPIVTDPSVPYSEAFSKYFSMAHYKPLVYVSWKAEYNLFGAGPWHFHLINWLLHWANTLLLFFIGIKLFEKLYDNKALALFSSFLLALFFTINPLRIESVVWATERKDVLFSFFFLSSWLLYFQYLKEKRYVFMLLAGLLFLLAGLSKSMTITLVAVLFLTDLWMGRSLKPNLMTEKILFFAITFLLLYFYGLFNLFSHGAATGGAPLSANEAQNLITNVPLISNLPYMLQWLFTTSVRFILWALHTFIPVRPSILYSHNTLFNSLGATIFVFPILIAALFLWAWIGLKKSPVFIGGLLFFAITLSPALVLKSSGTFVFLSDRYTYIPSIGLFFILVFVVNKLINKKRTLYYSVVIALTLFYAGVTVKNIPNWENSERLYKHAIEVTSTESMLYQNLAKLYKREKKYGLEFKTYNEGIKNIPNDYLLYNSRGKVYFNSGKLDLALADYNKCLALSPNFQEGLTNRGAIYGVKKEYGKALADLNKVLEANPENTNALSNRGVVYLQLKEYRKTIDDYNAYLRTKPDDPDIISAIGLCYSRLNQPQKAIVEYNKAIDIDPAKGAYYLNRSFALNATGDVTSALNDAEKAKQLGEKVNEGYINFLKNRVAGN